MQVVDDECTHALYFLGHRNEIRNHDRHHAGRRSSADTHVRIFEGKAERRRDAQQPRRLQEWIGLGLVALAIVVRHDMMKAIDHAVGFQMAADGRA